MAGWVTLSIRRIAAILAVVALLFSAGATLADDTSEANKLFVEAVKLVKSAENAEWSPFNVERLKKDADALEKTLEKLNEIIDDYPPSDLAGKLISGQDTGSITLEDVRSSAEWARKAAERAAEEAQELKKNLKAAEQGHASGLHNLGVFYEYGYGVPQSDAEAVKWFRKAADQGDAGAQYILGIMCENGWGVPENDAEAVKWFRKAAEQGHEEAKERLEQLED